MHNVARAIPLLVLLTACKDKGESAPPTYYSDVAPILDSRCVGCHVEGGIAPLALDSYEAASRYAALIATEVAERRMPPGQADNDCQTYVFDPSLPDDQIQTLVDWADAGAEAGDSSEAVVTPLDVDPVELDRVDLEVQMPVAYTPANAPDDYRCFPMDWPAESETYVTGFGVEPGNAAIVHHVIMYVIPPENRETYEAFDDADEGAGYTCFGGPGQASPADRPQWLGGWVPGQTGRNMPEGTGIAIEPGSMLIMEVHYYVGSNPDPGSDQSTMLLRVDDVVEHEGITQPFADPNWVLGGEMLIPAGETRSFSFTKELTSTMKLHDVGLHMHTHGTSGTVTVAQPGGEETCALQIDNWDFNWQRDYRLTSPIELEDGATMTVTCNFSNDTPADLNWGESTEDEMCLGITYLEYTD